MKLTVTVSCKGRHRQILEYIFLLLHQIYRKQFGDTLAPIQAHEYTSSGRQRSREIEIFQCGKKMTEVTLRRAKVM